MKVYKSFEEWAEKMEIRKGTWTWEMSWEGWNARQAEIDQLKDALRKIADPRLRHKELDLYTEIGCIMNIADQALNGKT